MRRFKLWIRLIKYRIYGIRADILGLEKLKKKIEEDRYRLEELIREYELRMGGYQPLVAPDFIRCKYTWQAASRSGYERCIHSQYHPNGRHELLNLPDWPTYPLVTFVAVGYEDTHRWLG